MEFRRLGIVGGGHMGRAIAQKAASSGIDVVVVEVTPERADAAKAELVTRLEAELGKWGITPAEKQACLARVQFTSRLAELASTDLVIECVPEDLERKKQVMHDVGNACPPDLVLISNTSTLSITEIAAATAHPERVVGMHFMHSVSRSSMVEIVRGSETSDATFARAVALASALGKEVIEVFESPGYVVTRAIVPFLNEAMHLVMEGVASAEAVDRAIRLGFEFKVGPLEYSDRVGLDVVQGWMEHLFHELGDVKYRPCPLLRKYVRAGRLGRKSGRGFFRYEGDRRLDAAAEAVR